MSEQAGVALEFVFLWWPDNEYGVVPGSEYHTLVKRFHSARRTARTWGGFIARMGDDAGYLTDFMQFDSIRPKDRDRLVDIRSDVWVLYDYEFPLT